MLRLLGKGSGLRGRTAGPVLAAVVSLAAAPAGAQLRPMPRPDGLPLQAAERPMPRPGAEPAGAEPVAPPARPEPVEAQDTATQRPHPPEIDRALAERVAAAGQAEVAQRAAALRAIGRLWLAETGPLCGDPRVRGERVEPVDGAGECGIPRPVRVEWIAGVELEPAAVLACPAVRALAEWLEESAKPAFAADGAALARLGIAAGYVCRNVNYAEEGEVSEHALGLAVDVSRFEREDGETVTVLEGWGSEGFGPLLREIHGDACGIFGTALGPESDAFHQDHFHYDAVERRRPYCPAGLAEAEEEQARAADEPGSNDDAGAEPEEPAAEPGEPQAVEQEDGGEAPAGNGAAEE